MTTQMKREYLVQQKCAYVRGYGWYYGDAPWKGPNGYGTEAYFLGRNADDAYQELRNIDERNI